MNKKKRPSSRNQFHPPFCAAMELEFRDEVNMFYLEQEHILNTKPNTIDLLIVKKDIQYCTHNGLGAIFRKHNLLEFKSPGSALDQKTFHRTLAYAHLYIAYHKEQLSFEDISISFIREYLPHKLMQYLRSIGYNCTEYEPGIFHFKKDAQFAIQIIATQKLLPKYKWITKLSDHLNKDDFLDIEKELEGLGTPTDIINAESVIDLMTKLNMQKPWMKEVKGMGAFRDYFGPSREEIEKEYKQMQEETEKKYKQIQENTEKKYKQIQENTEKKYKQIQENTEKKYKEKLSVQEQKLQNQEQENSRLKEEIKQLKEQLQKQVKSAML